MELEAGCLTSKTTLDRLMSSELVKLAKDDRLLT